MLITATSYLDRRARALQSRARKRIRQERVEAAQEGNQCQPAHRRHHSIVLGSQNMR